jgi:hypothetical protein
MNSADPSPRYPLLRPLTLAVAVVAFLVATTGTISSFTLLAWTIVVIAAATFAASFFLNARL